jgi:hypothetical protein
MLHHESENSEPTPEPLSDDGWYAELIAGGVSPLMARAQVRHRRDLPELLKEHPGRWVAYFGDERIALGETKRQLVEKCVQLGLKDDEFLVRAIAAESDPEIDASLWMHI